jgi:hypothetical protein
MRWSDERWIKVYTRDTGDWLALGWEAQALFLFALRKADAAGVVRTGKMRLRGLSGMTGVPLNVVERAAPLLLEDGCLRESDGGYIIPNFMAAQEARTSDAQRKREQRERDRADAMASGMPPSTSAMVVESLAASARDVTIRDQDRDISHAMSSQIVTESHTASQEVTGSHSASRLEERRREEKRGDLPPPASAGRNELRLEPQEAPRHARKRQPKTEKPTDPRHTSLVQLLVTACQETAGYPYRFNGGVDAAAVRDLLASADQDAATRGDAAPVEVVRRWKIGLRWRWANGEAPVQDLPSLQRRWNSCASTATAPPAKVSTGPTMSDFSSVLGTNLYGTEPT